MTFATTVRLGLALVLLTFGAGYSGAQAQTTLEVDEASGLFVVKENSAVVVKSQFVFWRGDWIYTDPNLTVQAAGSTYTLKGATEAFNIDGVAKQTAPRVMALAVDVKKAAVADLYGGMVFNVSPIDPERGLPVLLPDGSGWSLPVLGGKAAVEFRFDRAVQLHFEQGDPREIRAYFVSKDDQASAINLTVSLPDGGKVITSTGARLNKPDARWYKHVAHWNELPVDLSFMNSAERPAGKRGFVRADGEKLVFEDGSEGRFWGTNVTASALFATPTATVPIQAKRLSKLGFNLVRLHHHDSDWVGFNVFGNTYTGKLNETALERIDWWIKCLKDEGIYVWLDLHTGRSFRASDNIASFDEIEQGKPTKAFGFTYINSDIQARMQEFNAAFLTRVNTFTGVSYAQEPAIVANLITNENDLTAHFGNSLLPDKNVPHHNKIYMAAAREFATKNSLDEDAVWQSWRPGVSKLFLNDLEHVFNARMISHLRSLGARAPLVTTNFWGEMSLSSLPALTEGDIIDAHSYGRADLISSNPKFESNIMHWVAAASVAGKPLTVTEWNVEPFPSFDRATLSPQMAAIASLQGWSGLMQYAYAQHDLGFAGSPDNWTSANDPAFVATLPVSALLYRQGHVAPAQKTYVLKLTAEALMGDVNPKTSRAIRTITETSKLRIAMPSIPSLPWLKASAAVDGAIDVTDANFDAIPAEASHVCSDTGEICRSWTDGVLTINTPLTQLAAGWLGGKPTSLKSVAIDVTTPNAVVAVQSLDAQPIETSGDVLISATAQSLPTSGNRLPYLSEPVEGSVTIKAKAGLTAYALGRDGRRPLTTSYKDGAYVVPLTAGLQTFWVALTAR